MRAAAAGPNPQPPRTPSARQIVAQLRPLLRQYVAFPKFVDSNQIEGDIPSLLASKLLPDQVGLCLLK
jgi:hypothetical protein